MNSALPQIVLRYHLLSLPLENNNEARCIFFNVDKKGFIDTTNETISVLASKLGLFF